MSDQLKVGDRYKERNKLYQIDLITDNFVILSAVHGDLDDGMIIRLEEFEVYGLKNIEDPHTNPTFEYSVQRNVLHEKPNTPI